MQAVSHLHISNSRKVRANRSEPAKLRRLFHRNTVRKESRREYRQWKQQLKQQVYTEAGSAGETRDTLMHNTTLTRSLDGLTHSNQQTLHRYFTTTTSTADGSHFGTSHPSRPRSSPLIPANQHHQHHPTSSEHSADSPTTPATSIHATPSSADPPSTQDTEDPQHNPNTSNSTSTPPSTPTPTPQTPNLHPGKPHTAPNTTEPPHTKGKSSRLKKLFTT